MSQQTITVRVPVNDAWDASDRLQVYTDFGSGTIDLTKPLLSRQSGLFTGQHPARGVGRQPVGRGRVGSGKASRARGGVGRTRVGRTPVGRTPPFVDLIVDVPAEFGTWKFAVGAVDRDGTVQSGGLQETSLVVSGTDPPPLASFAFDSYDGGNDQVTFDIEQGTD